MSFQALLAACAELVDRVLRFDHPADAVVARYFREHSRFGPRERAVLAETAYAVLRRKPWFEHCASCALPDAGSRARRLAILGFHGPREVLKSALDEAEQAWLERCEAIGLAGLSESYRHNLPDWLALPLKRQLGEEFWALAESLGQSAPLHLRVNVLMEKRSEVQKQLAQAAIRSELTRYSPWGLRLEGKPALARLDVFTRGAVEVQDEGSQLLALLLEARRGEMVVDFCAGAGGKTLALGAAMRNTGRLYAFDTSAHRLDALKPRLARSGLSNVHPVVIAHEHDERIGRLAGKIDRVLVDAPCSGLGTLRRNPDLKWRQSPRTVSEFVLRQSAILARAARLPRCGGRLVYATCGVLPEENEAVAEAFTAAHPGFVRLPVAQVLAGLKVEGAAGLCSGGAAGGDYLRLWPHRHGTDGFFAAIWTRI